MSSSRIFGVLSGLLLVLPVAGCGLVDTGPSVKDVASAYVSSFASGDSAAAARQTDRPKAAQPALEATRRSLGAKAVSASLSNVSEGDDTRPAQARFDVSMDFGNGRVWKYQGQMGLTEGDQGWKVKWAPSVIHPALTGAQTLAFQENKPEPAPVLGRDGKQLMGPEQLVTVTLDAKQAGDIPGVAGSLAKALGTIDPQITQKSILDGVAGTPPGQPYTVVTLRQADYDRVRPQIYQLPGVHFRAQQKLLAPEREYGSQILPSVAKHVDEQLTAQAGWSVAAVNPDGSQAKVFLDTPAQPAQPVTTTLSDPVQKAAEQAVDPVPQAAMVVALQPSSGDVLAVAQNKPADQQGAVALTGQYPPGSTFKMITGYAGLEAGKVNINAPVHCPASKVFDGRTIPNDKNFDLGTVPLRTAFAKSCNTTFAQLAVDLPARALSDTAQQLGVGVDFTIPGITTITGKVKPAEQVVQRAANGIGQGDVLTSPFGMALATASVARGSMPTPTLIKGAPTQSDSAGKPLSPEVLGQLRPMMREVVTGGTATRLAGSGEVAGKTGTAQFGDGKHSHGWFVGYRGDLAFAVLVTDAGASAPAVEAAQRFLSNTP